MPIQQITVERFIAISSKPFDDILKSIHDAIGHPDLAQMQREVALATTYSQMESIIDKAVGPTGLMQFLHLDMGMYPSQGTHWRNASQRPHAGRKPFDHAANGRARPGHSLLRARHHPDRRTPRRSPPLVRPDDQLPRALWKRSASAVAADLDRKVEALLSAAAESSGPSEGLAKFRSSRHPQPALPAP